MGFLEVMGEVRVWHALIAQFWHQVGDDKHFIRVVAEQLFQLMQIVAIHRNHIIEMVKVAGLDFAAVKTSVVYAQVGKNFGRAHMHVFAIVPTLGACTVYADACRQALFGRHIAQ